MTILPTAVDTAAPDFRANAERMRALTAEFRERRAEGMLVAPKVDARFWKVSC